MNASILLLAFSLAAADAAPGPSATQIEIPSALVKLVEQVDVPAREAGVLAAVDVREGQMVEEGDRLGQIEDTEARIAEERARIDLQIARENAENDVNIRFATKSVEVARAELRRSAESLEKYPKSVSESEMDRLRLIVEKSVLEVTSAMGLLNWS